MFHFKKQGEKADLKSEITQLNYEEDEKIKSDKQRSHSTHLVEADI